MIDPSKLPTGALMDTNALIRGLGDRPNDPESPACLELFQAMTSGGREIMIAAPTISEILRFGGATGPVPNIGGASVVAFDARAADILGRSFPQTTFVELRAQTNIVAGYYKYDALIVACAMRWGAPMVVALDVGVHALCERVGMAHKYPAYFQLPAAAPSAAPIAVSAAATGTS